MEFNELIISEKDYKDLVFQTVGGYIPHVKHTIVICEDGEKLIAVANYFKYNITTMFLHRCWFSMDVGLKSKQQCWVEFYGYIRSLGFERVMGVIDSDNIPAIIWSLKTGWKIVGSHNNSNGHLILDVVITL
jgi:hypothetical protein